MSYRTTPMKCDDCGHKFRKVLENNTYITKCPKCKSECTDIDIERELDELERLANK